MKSIKSIIGDRETVTVERSSLVRAAARLMADRNIGAVPVLDGDRLAGIFSERDVLTRVVAVGCDPDTTRVGDVMSSELVVAGSGRELRGVPGPDAARLMSDTSSCWIRDVWRGLCRCGTCWRWTSTRRTKRSAF